MVTLRGVRGGRFAVGMGMGMKIWIRVGRNRDGAKSGYVFLTTLLTGLH